ncbi:MAG: hypothetical protein GY757_21485, partial [bacterium]|nr:hypothetical protein [bacterium]
MRFLRGRYFGLSLLAAFAFTNWYFLAVTEKIAPPDFYKLYNTAENLLSGNFNSGIIPPLFPLLLYPLGKLCTLFFKHADAFIFAGKLIALFAGLGTLFFSFLFLEKFTAKYATIGIAFLAISPWFLKLLAFPITDMLYLLFVSATFYFLSKNSSETNQTGPGPVSPKKSWWFTPVFVIAGVLTRFEGVLLIVSWILNSFKLKKRYFYILLATSPLIGGLFFLFAKFTPRIYAHLTDIILARKSYLFIFQHPLQFLNVIYGNILFFIPYSYPNALKWVIFIVVLALFIYGIYRLFLINRNLTLALLAYELLFLVAKGYIDSGDPGREFRRIFSGLWLFYIIAFIGCVFLLKKIKSYKIPFYITLAAGCIPGVFLAFSQGLPNPQSFLFIFLLPALLLPFTNLSPGKIPKTVTITILVIFALQIYTTSLTKSRQYVESYAHKSGFAAAQWIKLARLDKGAVVLSFTDNNMVQYYLHKDKSTPAINLVHFTVPMRNSDENRQLYIDTFRKLLKENK